MSALVYKTVATHSDSSARSRPSLALSFLVLTTPPKLSFYTMFSRVLVAALVALPVLVSVS